MTLTLLYKVTYNHSFTHRWQSQLCRVTASWSGAVKVRSCSGTPQRRDKLATFRLPVNPLYLLLWDTGARPVSQLPWPNAFCSVPVPKRYKNSNMSSNVTQESLFWPHQTFPRMQSVLQWHSCGKILFKTNCVWLMQMSKEICDHCNVFAYSLFWKYKLLSAVSAAPIRGQLYGFGACANEAVVSLTNLLYLSWHLLCM